MKILIGIPARYASKRLPGKPLLKIAGKEMVARVYDVAQEVIKQYPKDEVIAAVATEDQRIKDFCDANNMLCYLTSDKCLTGTDRVAELAEKLESSPEFVINLQGDNPICPPEFVKSIIDAYYDDNSVEIVTPVINLSWNSLEKFKKIKEITPFSGTCCVVKTDGQKCIKEILDQNTWSAVWFSKTIIPALRKEDKLKEISPFYSPVLKHIGVYGYRLDVLKEIAVAPETIYSSAYTESLEQLRFITMGYDIKAVKVDNQEIAAMPGVDSPEDLQRAEEYFVSLAKSKSGNVVDFDSKEKFDKAVGE